jgi:hypothetical protein
VVREHVRETSRSDRDLAACKPLPRHLFAPFRPKTSDASFCSVRHKRSESLPVAGGEQP